MKLNIDKADLNELAFCLSEFLLLTIFGEGNVN